MTTIFKNLFDSIICFHKYWKQSSKISGQSFFQTTRNVQKKGYFFDIAAILSTVIGWVVCNYCTICLAIGGMWIFLSAFHIGASFNGDPRPKLHSCFNGTFLLISWRKSLAQNFAALWSVFTKLWNYEDLNLT